METLVTSPIALLALLSGIIVVLFGIERRYAPALFKYLPPLVWVYFIPVILSQLHVIPNKSDAYTAIKTYGLPLFLTAMLVEIDLKAAFGVMRSAVSVVLCGTIGIVVGITSGYAIVHPWLSPEAWKGYGSLAGSWIGGLGNMVAVTEAVQTPGPELGLAIVADNVGYLIWLPLLLASKRWAKIFSRWSKSSEDSLETMVATQAHLRTKSKEVAMFDLIGLLFVGFTVAALGEFLAPYLIKIPVLGPLLGKTTWKVLVLTSIAIPLSFTPVRRLRGNSMLGMTIIYLFVAVMGARANLAGMAQAPMFVVGACIALVIHAVFLLVGARLFKTDVHITSVASMANIGGAASAPIVAAYHHEELVPISILLALVGYAVGNYAAIATAYLCAWIGG